MRAMAKRPVCRHRMTLICVQSLRIRNATGGVLAVMVTLLLQKLHNPQQDIRRHQAQLAGGFSGRGLDTRVVTPFLRDRRFPYMQGGSGWLTALAGASESL